MQARKANLKIKKGSKAVPVFKGFSEKTEIGKDGKTKTVSLPLGCAYVFNLDQTEKL